MNRAPTLLMDLRPGARVMVAGKMYRVAARIADAVAVRPSRSNDREDSLVFMDGMTPCQPAQERA